MSKSGAATQKELHLRLSAVDTLMFRDGRPFNQGDPGATDAVSVFPPPPPTVVGILRAWLARSLGWDGRTRWDHESLLDLKLTQRLGDGVDWATGDKALKDLTISASTLLQGDLPLYPAPRLLLSSGAEKERRLTRLRPGKGVQTDLGMTRMPEPIKVIKGPPLEGLKELERTWVKRRGLEAILAGDLPDLRDLVDEVALWRPERRIGIGIDMAGEDVNNKPISRLEFRRPIDGALYAATHTRPAAELGLAVTVSTADRQGLPSQSSVALSAAGGEHRMAEISNLGKPIAPPNPPAKMRSEANLVHYVVYHASPCRLVPLPGPSRQLADLPGKVVAACLGKAQVIGGWDSGRAAPIGMVPVIPAGSVWFMEAAPNEVKAIKDRHGKSIGQSTRWGFGQDSDRHMVAFVMR